jgi:hypothetical protein
MYWFLHRRVKKDIEKDVCDNWYKNHGYDEEGYRKKEREEIHSKLKRSSFIRRVHYLINPDKFIDKL